MGKRGKPGKSKGRQGGLGSLISGAKQTLGGGKPGAAPMSGGLYRVNSRTGEIVKVQQKKRRKGYRMPKYVAEQMRANAELTRNVATAVILNQVSK